MRVTRMLSSGVGGDGRVTSAWTRIVPAHPGAGLDDAIVSISQPHDIAKMTRKKRTSLGVGLISLGRLARVYARDLATRIPASEDPVGSTLGRTALTVSRV
jgi:hypothetical protein